MTAKPTRDPAIFKLVEQQLRNWELAHSQHQTSQTSSEGEVEDFICISRMVGIDGHLIATGLGNRLGWPVFGREILDAMAGDDTIRQRIYKHMDERDLSWWEECVRGVLGGFTRNDYFRKLCETVLSLARKSPSVFVGRGIDLILPQDRGFRVRLVASVESRVQGMSPSAEPRLDRSVEDLQRVERQRQEFLKNHFGIEADDPLRHDLIVNLDRWPTAGAVKLILDAQTTRVATRT